MAVLHRIPVFPALLDAEVTSNKKFYFFDRAMMNPIRVKHL